MADAVFSILKKFNIDITYLRGHMTKRKICLVFTQASRLELKKFPR
jgi:hypothetical protein